MNPLEFLRDNMDPLWFAGVEKAIADGATWDWANFTNEVALEGPESETGIRTYYVVIDIDEDDFEVSDAFENKYVF
jgi:hypothetical protein